MDLLISTAPVFNRSRFQVLALHDDALEASLIDSFFQEIDQMRSSIVAAAREGLAAFLDAAHHVTNVAHFIGGDRLTLLLTQLRKRFPLVQETDRCAMADLIVRELSALEQALAAEKASLSTHVRG
jgi:hypothetical protein